ncbi:porin family protein [Chitinophaga sp. Cy-1792]|uniref:porin family protein n=1 Tax=Chitinophaga sp. Cy-1792 TaxID=2608339 RepID=UPI00141D8DB1|nr:porin family protein [Chitinophaga sp. Cy-1792]NIG56470.1 PorT family protein [Chitinophaga sp. Cy-1792]
MKKITLVLTVLCCSSFAQAQFRVGVKAGVGASYHSKFKTTDTYFSFPPLDNYLNGHQASYYAGVTADWQLSGHLSLQPSLLYSVKGGKTGITNYISIADYPMPVDQKGEDRLHYLELPVTLLYKHKLGSGKAFAGAGLYQAMYLDGSKKGDFSIREWPKYKQPIPQDGGDVFEGRRGPLYDGNQADAKLWDTGANFTAGYELPFGVQLALNYSLGFNETYYGKNRVYSLSVSYLLHK